jgi:hypothetical protein
MKRKMQIAALGCAAVLLCGISIAEADVVTLTADQSAVVTAPGVEDTRVALQFDLSGVSGARVDLAILEWPVAGMPSEAMTEYRLVPITASWTEAGLVAAAPGLAETDAGWWAFTPRDYEVNGGGLVRFDVTALVSEWASGRTANHGLAVVTSDLDRETVTGQLENVKLTITYLP